MGWVTDTMAPFDPAEWFKGDQRFGDAMSDLQNTVDMDMLLYEQKIFDSLAEVQPSDGSVQVFDGDGYDERVISVCGAHDWSVTKSEPLPNGQTETILMVYHPRESWKGGEVGYRWDALAFVRTSVKSHITFKDAKLMAQTDVQNGILLTLHHA